ncbi:hypothetical protein WA026_012522 [Henosepilachna vigintioctopunctata]|uniref:Uncharacterized protein n=1 Tax=Henosepilachna vigintioctopunctata TaxID=420089 RepID=A0AAW1TXA6_9CUCU
MTGERNGARYGPTCHSRVGTYCRGPTMTYVMSGGFHLPCGSGLISHKELTESALGSTGTVEGEGTKLKTTGIHIPVPGMRGSWSQDFRVEVSKKEKKHNEKARRSLYRGDRGVHQMRCRARAAHDYAWPEASKNKDVLFIVLKPNRKLCSTGSWIVNLDIDIAVRGNKGMEVENVQRQSGYVRIQ